MSVGRHGRRLAYVLLAAGLCACKGSATTPTPSEPPTLTNTISITDSGTSPHNIQIAVGTRVLFINDDTRSHNMTSDPHPEHTDCPELNQVGFLSAGQRRESGNLVEVRTCGYHDHDNPGTQGLRGQIVIK